MVGCVKPNESSEQVAELDLAVCESLAETSSGWSDGDGGDTCLLILVTSLYGDK